MGEIICRQMTVDEFLVWDGEGDRRYELVRGEVVEMGRPTNAHGLIVAHVIGEVGQRVKPPCLAITAAGIALSWRNDTYYQADLAVTHGPIRRGDHITPNPVLIVEVLSPTTVAHDRVIKLVDYRHIESVQEIILVASDEKRVEHFRRGDAVWTMKEFVAGDMLPLDSIGFDFPVAALYEGLDFSAGIAAES
jgi:Uma2 family endonuclease